MEGKGAEEGKERIERRGEKVVWSVSWTVPSQTNYELSERGWREVKTTWV